MAGEGKNYLYLIWKEPSTRRNYTIGELTKNGGYEFKYGHEIEAAIDAGFRLLVSFDDRGKTYNSKTLFPTFASRLPDEKRRDIQSILDKYKLKDFDEFELLKKSGARLPIDNMEFIQPIFDDEKDVEREFFLAGPKYYIGCEGQECEKAIDVEVGMELVLYHEKTNKADSNAVKVNTIDTRPIGYIPRYYSSSIVKAIDNKQNVSCIVTEYSREKLCNECIKVKLKMGNSLG